MALDGWDSPSASCGFISVRLARPPNGAGPPSGIVPLSVGTAGWGRIRMGNTFALMHSTRSIFDLLDKANELEYVVQAHHVGGSQMVVEGELSRSACAC